MGVRILSGTGPVGPPILPSLPSLGRDGWGHYWHAARATSDNSGVALSQPDAGSPADPLLPVTVDGTAPLPTVGNDGSLPYIRFGGQDLQGSQSLATPRSTLIVLRTAAKNVPIARRAGCAFSRAANGFWKVSPVAGATILGAAATNTDGWMVIIVNQDPAAPFAMFNGAVVTGAAYTPSAIASVLTPTHPVTKGNFGDVALSATWPFYFTTDDAAAVYAAVKASAPGVLS